MLANAYSTKSKNVYLANVIIVVVITIISVVGLKYMSLYKINPL